MRLPATVLRYFVPTLCSLILVTVVMLGCRRSPSAPSNQTTPGPQENAQVEFPDGDPSVPPELGGPGFTGEGWQTASPGPLGDPRAVKGGSIISYIPNWPENLRVYGTGSNTYLNSIVESLCYESLLSLHPETLEPVPSLASHWKISDDNMEISAEDVDFSNEAKETQTCSYSGSPMQIGFNAKFLIEMLGAIGSDEILLKLDSPNRAGIMVPSEQDEGEDLMMLVMPVMINH